jgi:predicted DNA-binding transcriptional regulator YafY
VLRRPPIWRAPALFTGAEVAAPRSNAVSADAVVQRKRLVPDRFKRIWAIVEAIDRQPGLTRAELANRFALSERQLQADLNVVRREIGLPLIREHGYRFGPDIDAEQTFSLRDVHTLFLVVRCAANDPSVPREALDELTGKLHRAFPITLQPLVRKALAPWADPGFGPSPEAFAMLADALARQQPVKLRYAPHSGMGFFTEPIVDPHFVLPHLSSMYLIGHCHQRQRELMFPLDSLLEVCTDLGPAEVPYRPEPALAGGARR